MIVSDTGSDDRHAPLAGDALVRALERRFVLVNDDVRAGHHMLNVIRPRSAEDLIDEGDFERDERLPYWAELWPSSTVLADHVLAEGRAACRAIELGSGIGLVAMAAALAGHDSLATDYYEDALLFARANSFRNLGRELPAMIVDWRAVPSTLGRFDLVLASDVLYERRYADLVAGVIDRLLAAHGTALVADPGRIAGDAFAAACRERGLYVETRATRPYLAGDIRQTISVLGVMR